MRLRPVLLATGFLACAVAAMAQDHSAHGAAGGMEGDTPFITAYRAVNAEMHAGTDIPFTGDSDIDFARGMIPHHQGAVDMARVELQYGTDPEMRAFAEKVIAAQEAEITFLKEWLAQKGH